MLIFTCSNQHYLFLNDQLASLGLITCFVFWVIRSVCWTARSKLMGGIMSNNFFETSLFPRKLDASFAGQLCSKRCTEWYSQQNTKIHERVQWWLRIREAKKNTQSSFARGSTKTNTNKINDERRGWLYQRATETRLSNTWQNSLALELGVGWHKTR